jgi:hypothetical protein
VAHGIVNRQSRNSLFGIESFFLGAPNCEHIGCAEKIKAVGKRDPDCSGEHHDRILIRMQEERRELRVHGVVRRYHDVVNAWEKWLAHHEKQSRRRRVWSARASRRRRYNLCWLKTLI